MKMISGAAVAPFHRVPASLLIYARSVSDDDLCGWCNSLIYDPGEESLCQRHDGTAWPGSLDVNGYVTACPCFQSCSPDHSA